MDNVAEHAWSPRAGEVAVAAVGGLVLAAFALTTDDAAGRVIVGLAAAGLLVVAAVGALRRPRVVADSEGVTLRGAFGTRHLAWQDVATVLLRSHRRLGVEVGMLEISGGTGDDDILLVISRTDLGTDPRDVHPVLNSLHQAALQR